jgi:hypothetical protein
MNGGTAVAARRGIQVAVFDILRRVARIFTQEGT